MADDTVEFTDEVDDYEEEGADEPLPRVTHPASGADAAAFVEVNNLAVSDDGQEVEALTAVPALIPAAGSSGLVPELVYVFPQPVAEGMLKVLGTLWLRSTLTPESTFRPSPYVPAMANTTPSASRPSSCAFASPRLQPSSFSRARWS